MRPTSVGRFKLWYYIVLLCAKMEEIVEGINSEDENDLIKKANLSWLKEQMRSILELYKAT